MSSPDLSPLIAPMAPRPTAHARRDPEPDKDARRDDTHKDDFAAVLGMQTPPTAPPSDLRKDTDEPGPDETAPIQTEFALTPGPGPGDTLFPVGTTENATGFISGQAPDGSDTAQLPPGLRDGPNPDLAESDPVADMISNAQPDPDAPKDRAGPSTLWETLFNASIFSASSGSSPGKADVALAPPTGFAGASSVTAQTLVPGGLQGVIAVAQGQAAHGAALDPPRGAKTASDGAKAPESPARAASGTVVAAPPIQSDGSPTFSGGRDGSSNANSWTTATTDISTKSQGGDGIEVGQIPFGQVQFPQAQFAQVPPDQGQLGKGQATTRHVARQLAAAISTSSDGKSDILLNPAELGRVRMQIDHQGTGITMLITADRPETADLMRRHLDTLAQEFRAMGYRDIGFSFSGGSQGQHDGHPDLPGRPYGSPSDALAADALAKDTGPGLGPVEPTRRMAQAGLDLRL